MQFPEDSIILYPSTLEEAVSTRESHPYAVVISTLTAMMESDTILSPDAVIIDLSRITELNFFMEDHGWWFIGASLPLDELSEISAERLPSLSSILLHHEDPPLETFPEWILRMKGRFHIATTAGMQEQSPQNKGELRFFPHASNGIPCMISIPKM